MTIAVGTVLEGTVTGITKFGAFVELPGGVTGLVHISEVADSYVKDVKDYLKERDKVKVKVINVDANGKIGLSIKQADPDYKPRPKNNRFARSPQSFEDKLARYLKDSDERQQELHRNEEVHRTRKNARSSR